MCIYCDLNKGGEEAESARFHANDIIETCQSIIGGYKAVLSGHIKPHSEEMKSLCSAEKHLIRHIILDVI